MIQRCSTLSKLKLVQMLRSLQYFQQYGHQFQKQKPKLLKFILLKIPLVYQHLSSQVCVVSIVLQHVNPGLLLIVDAINTKQSRMVHTKVIMKVTQKKIALKKMLYYRSLRYFLYIYSMSVFYKKKMYVDRWCRVTWFI